jgi:hypothetical protein
MPNQGYYSQRVGGSPRPNFWRQEGWQRGQNSYAEDNEVRDVEWYKARNIEIIGRSTLRLPRRGGEIFSTIVGGTDFNGWGVYKNPKTGVNKLIVQHTGRVYGVDTVGNATEIDPTKTWNTTAKMRGVLLREWFYFGNGEDYMAKTNGASIVRWALVDEPAGLSASVTSTAADDTSYGFVVTAVTDQGETGISNEYDVFAPGNLDFTSGDYIDLSWTKNTEPEVVGYNVYKSINGRTLLLLTFVDQPIGASPVTYRDDGAEEVSLIYEAPEFNTTGGVKGNIFGKYANTLFVTGNPDEPDTVFYGGTGANWESFSPNYNGGWLRVGRGDGEKVTALIGFEDFLFILKENSIWKFFFGSDGSPTLVAVIPQYGTSSPDTVWRMEKDVIFYGSDGRFRILGYEPSQLNVIRTSDISNRIQTDLDALSKADLDAFFGVFFEQKYILANGSKAYPYDRRYIGFLGEWTNYQYSRFIVWDKGTGQQKLFGASRMNGEMHQLLVDNTYSDPGDVAIDSFVRFKRIDGGNDNLKYFDHTKFKLKFPKGRVTFLTYKDGSALLDGTPINFDVGGGVDEYMFDEPMFDEGLPVADVEDAVRYVIKDLEFESYSYYHQINVNGDQFNHTLIQTMSGMFEVEDIDYRRDERVI